METVAQPGGDKAAPSKLLQVTGLLYIVSTPLDVVELPLAAPATLTGGLFLFLCLLAWVRGGIAVPRAPLLLGLLAALVAWSFCTTLWSVAPASSIGQSSTTLLLAVSAVAISGVFTGSLTPPATALALGATVSGVAAMVSGREWIQNGTRSVQLEQVTFLGVDQNILAFHLSLGLAAAAFLILRSQSARLRLVALAMAATLSASLIMVGSRTGVGTLLGIGVLVVVMSATSLKRAGIALVALSVTSAVMMLISGAGLVPSRVVEWIQNPIAMDGRSAIVDSYLVTWSEWAIKGIGAGSDAYYLQLTTGWWFKNAHSAFWKAWIELGIVGLLLWILLVVGLGLRAFLSRERLFFGLCTIPIVLFFYTLAPLNSNMLWVIFGLALGATITTPAEERAGRPMTDPARSKRTDPHPARIRSSLLGQGHSRPATASRSNSSAHSE